MKLWPKGGTGGSFKGRVFQRGRAPVQEYEVVNVLHTAKMYPKVITYNH